MMLTVTYQVGLTPIDGVMCERRLGNFLLCSTPQVVQMPLGSVTRDGSMGDSSLLVFVPSVTAESARESGVQIRVLIISLGIKILDDQLGWNVLDSKKPGQEKILIGSFHEH